MDEEMFKNIKTFNMLGFSRNISDSTSAEYSYIPLLTTEQDKRKVKDCAQEEEIKANKIQAAKLLGGLAFTKDNSKECTYIPLQNFIDKKSCKSCIREIRSNYSNFLFDFNNYALSETCSVTRNIHANSYPKNYMWGNRVRNQSVGCLLALNECSPIDQNVENKNVAIKVWTANEFTKTEREIYAGIKCCFRRFLIIWCITSDIESELVHSWIKKTTTSVYDRWIHKDKHYTKDSWGGVIAVYPDNFAAKKAAQEIPQQHQSLMTIELSNVINFFVKSELKYYSEEKAQILIKAKIYDREKIKLIQAMLHRVGQVEFCGYDYVVKNSIVIFQVTYAFATHAFLAQIVLDNLPFVSILIDVEVQMTPKMKAILDDFHSQLKNFAGIEHFLY